MPLRLAKGAHEASHSVSRARLMRLHFGKDHCPGDHAEKRSRMKSTTLATAPGLQDEIETSRRRQKLQGQGKRGHGVWEVLLAIIEQRRRVDWLGHTRRSQCASDVGLPRATTRRLVAGSKGERANDQQVPATASLWTRNHNLDLILTDRSLPVFGVNGDMTYVVGSPRL